MRCIQCTHKKPFHWNVHSTQDAQDLVLVVGEVSFQDACQALQVALQGGGALWEGGTRTSDTATFSAVTWDSEIGFIPVLLLERTVSLIRTCMALKRFE